MIVKHLKFNVFLVFFSYTWSTSWRKKSPVYRVWFFIWWRLWMITGTYQTADSVWFSFKFAVQEQNNQNNHNGYGEVRLRCLLANVSFIVLSNSSECYLYWAMLSSSEFNLLIFSDFSSARYTLEAKCLQ